MSGFVGRTGALLAVGSAVLHGAALGPANPGGAVLTVTMLIGCLYCAYELWTRDTVRSWVLVALMNLAMIGVHLPVTGAHHHDGGPAAAVTPMQLATVVAIVEALLAATVLLVRTRAVAPGVDASCQSGLHDSGGITGRPAGRDLHRLPEPN